MLRAVLSVGFAAFCAAHASGQTGEVFVVTGKIVPANAGEKMLEDYTFGQTVVVTKTKTLDDVVWGKVETKSKQGAAWVDTAALRKLQPLTAREPGAKPLPPEIAKLFNDYFSPEENYKNNVSSPALKVIVDDSAKMKTLVGSLNYNAERLKKVDLSGLDDYQKKPLAEAIETYDLFARGVAALDKLAKISDEDYTFAWLKDAGLSVFTDAVLPALAIMYPGAGLLTKAATAGINASGLRDDLRNDKYYIKSLKEFRAKTVAAILECADSFRSAGTTIWLARSRDRASETTAGLAVDLRQYQSQAHLGYHAVTVVNTFDKPLTSAFIQVTIKGDKREECHAYHAVADWKPGQSLVLKCDPKGVTVDKRAFGKTSVSAPAKVTAEVICDQSANVLTAEYAHDDAKARQDLALFLRDHAKVSYKEHTYATRLLVGTGPGLNCYFLIEWPEEVTEIERINELEVTMVVMAGREKLNERTDVMCTTNLTALRRNGLLFAACDNLGQTKPDKVILKIRPKGVDCFPKSCEFAIEVK